MSTPLTTLKTAVLRPMPRARVKMTMTAKAGLVLRPFDVAHRRHFFEPVTSADRRIQPVAAGIAPHRPTLPPLANSVLPRVLTVVDSTAARPLQMGGFALPLPRVAPNES